MVRDPIILTHPHDGLMAAMVSTFKCSDLKMKK